MASIDRNMVFPIKNADGSSFYNLVIRKATVDSVVMSLGDKITGDVYYKDNTLQCTMHEYVEYNNVKYTIVNPPTIVREGLVKDNSDLKGMTKYSFEFYHPMYILGNLPFSDVADEKKYLSQNKTFSWIGKPQDYINKINKNLEGTEWIVVKSDRFPKEKDDELSDVLSFDNNTIADALKTGYETWGLPYVVSQINIGEPYYSQGKRFKVEFGLPNNEILVDNEPYIFQFGQGVGLKNNSRTPRNNKIITRISGYGSENNIPYGYPQIRWYGDQSATETPAGYPIYDGIVGGVVRKLIKHPFTRTHLMPSIYTQTVFNKVSPYLANGSANPDYNPDEEIVDYYDAVYSEEYPYINEINLLAPSYEIHGFDDIKPEFDSDRQLGIVSAIPLNQDLTPASQWDDTYDAEKDEYVQSYFKITLPQLSFDLYACASIMEEMQVNMRSGACIGCTFPIQVDWEDYKRNFYDADGNFLPDGSQRDLTKYPKSNLGQIDIIVQKETQTFGTLMPNIYQQPTANDLFVILGISMPVEYITDAEEMLDDAMKSYMLENNVYYYDYPLKFDEYFLTTHTNILAQIRPNSIIRFGFNGYPTPLELFVKQITVKYGDGVLPQYDITLTDNIEIVLNQIGQVADDVEKLGSLVAILRQTYNRNIWLELDKKLSKVKDDSTPHKLGMGEMQVDGDGAIGNDLSVGGDLSVAGDTELNGDVTIGASASNEAIVNAVMQVLAQMKSQNYVDDSPIGKGGWNLLSADDNGNSYMVIDKLFVRLKAIFNELEIRKISYAGGNIIFSHAGSEIVGVKPLYQNGSIYAYRCYFKKDDGTTATENWWKVDDQAKCQTFNIQEGVHQNVENTYYWRKVIAVGSEIASLDGTTSEELYNYADLSLGDCDANSDIPKAGDSIIQMGNRTDAERQGFISLEVFGSDAPAIKVYKGVNGYNLNNKMPIIISPKNTSMQVQHYEIKTDYGVFPAVKERGEWDLISNHRCYYFDRVQHNGSSWLCTYPQGSTPEYTTEEPSVNATYWKVDAQAGESAPSYTEEWYAWSNVQSVVNATTEPTPNGGWYQVIGGQGEYAYLWKKLIRYTWNSATRVYVAGTAQYFRMSGTNGTSISVKGSVATVADLPSTHTDGDAYVVEADRHLYMWSAESNQWLDIGEFKGEDGRTYYTHVAWATSVATNPSTGEVTNVTGFTIAKTADDTTHLWMGVYVDENSAADPDDALLYTWSYTKGVDGASITKISEVKTYANNKTSTQPADSAFTLTTRPTSTTQGKWLWTRTVITWSDTTTTKLYSSEYNSIDGANGQSINVGTQTIKYALTDSGNEHPEESSSEWKDTYTATKGKWLWSKITTPYTYSGGGSAGNSVSYSVSYLGTDGTNGTDGTSITVDTSKSKTEYAISNSSTTKPTSWQSTVPASQSGKYLWTKVTTAFSDNTSTVSYGVSYSGTNGADGTSVTITNESVTYAVTTTNSQPADSQFTYTTLPELTKGQYLWVKSVVTYSDGNTLKSYNVSFLGTDGTNGQNGSNGKTTHFAYATSADGSQNFSRTNFAGATYIGTYSDTSTTDSSSYTSYTWTRWRGNDGSSVTVDTSNSKTEYAKSTQGTSSSSVTGWSTTIPTVPQGQYLWTKVTTAYSDGTSTVSYGVSYNAEDGTDGTDGASVQLDSSRTFVKYCKQTSSQYTGTAPADSSFSPTFPSSLGGGDYLWTLSQTAYVGVTNPLKSYSVSRMGTDGEDGINGTDGYTTHFAYATSADGSTGFSTTNFSGATYIGTCRDKNAADSQTYTDYTWTKWKGDTGATGKGISNVTEYYLASTQNTGITNTTSGFSTTVPTLNSSKRYLWNYELVTYTDNSTSKTPASLKGFYSEDGVGIDEITNHYLATSASSGVTKETSGWTTTIQTIDSSKQYLWNYETITYTDNSTDETDPHIIGHYGKDGEVITKVNETYRYATNNTGTRPDASSSSWQTAKPTLQKGYWLYTETTIHWSNNTETVLYTSERNPNDGVAGQSIIVDGSTVMKYYVGSSSTTHPAEDSSDWKDLDQVTQTQGMWLWSKSTTYYRKANSTSGSHDAGSSVQYNVSYIAEDGDTPEAARGVESVTEYYKATNSSSPMSKPTSDSGWDTDPNLSNLTNKWSKTYKYLWNYEKVTYNKAPLVERTIPQILAIWTKDGNAGKGIDSITNYYLINNSSTAPSRPSTDGTKGWSTTPTPPNSSNPYLWNYEKIVWLNPSSTTYTDVQMIGHFGKDGTSSYVADLDNEMDSIQTDDKGYAVKQQSVSTNLKLYYGNTQRTFKTSVSYTSTTGMTVSWNNSSTAANTDTVTVTFTTTAKLTGKKEFAITLTDGTNTSISRTVYFVVNGISGDVYNIVPSVSEIVATRDASGNYLVNGSSTYTMGCKYTKDVDGVKTYYDIASNGSVDGKYYVFRALRRRSDQKWQAYSGGIVYDDTKPRYYYLFTGTGKDIDLNTFDAMEILLCASGAGHPTGWAPANGETAMNIIDRELVYVVANGENGVSVYLESPVTLFTQDINNTSTITQLPSKTNIIVKKGGTTVPLTDYTVEKPSSGLDDTHCTYSVTNTSAEKSVTISAIGTYAEGGKNYYYENGFARVNVTYEGSTYVLDYKFLLNAIGKFKTVIEGDVETSIANKTWYEYNPATGQYDKETTMGEFIRSSSGNISSLNTQVNDPATGLNHKYSVISQNVDKISLKVGQYYNLFYNAFFGELLADRSPYSNSTSIGLASEGTYGGKAIRMGGGYFSETITSSVMGSDTKGYGVYLDKGTYTFQMYARVSNDYSSSSSAFAGVLLIWDDNADFSTWSSSKIITGIKVTGTSYARYTYTFTLSSARYVGFRMILSSFSIGGTSFYLYIDAVMLEIGSTASSMISSYGGNQSGAEVGRVQRNLLATGIDIEEKKITMTADKFICQNNSGVKTAWLDEMGNWITTGVQNNLITVITSANATKYILSDSSGDLYLDVLRCGDFILIQSLPSSMIGGAGASNYKFIRLPYFINGGPAQRGQTKFLTGVQHSMLSDEMRQLVGRKITIRVAPSYTYTYLNGVANFNYYGTATAALRRICNSQKVFDFNNVTWQDYSMIPRVFHIECQHTVLVDGNNNATTHNAYIWTGQSDYLALTDDGLNWT